ncbi:hypothetical protein BEN47_15475 [Hymenobacter lapidarius]|uniref:Uncharacterized protein n=1 Tax=Hymenobacter lapidarius TaxID=1908237 RepID=A0A1G1T2C6_9BACT|nr:hypothetical protein [Hymenobacter lapidarius]OGX85035.1 hypothetical protein BEN47_15475 [Hymenobacter lapidarius]
MKNISSPFAKLIAVAACALTLGSCNRAEYAMLPKGSSYHGVTRVATPVPAKAPSTAVAMAPVAAESIAPQEVATIAPVAAPAAVATAAAKPEAATKEAAAAVAAASTVAAASAIATPAPKTNLAQRIALSKVTRKVDKLIQKSGSLRKHDNTASTAETSAISGNLRTGIIFLLVGLLVSLFSFVSSIFGLIGLIIAIIGLIFIILWLLDQA